jgi:hypothetical protein
LNSRDAMHHWLPCLRRDAQNLKTSAVGRLATSAQPAFFAPLGLKPDDSIILISFAAILL